MGYIGKLGLRDFEVEYKITIGRGEKCIYLAIKATCSSTPLHSHWFIITVRRTTHICLKPIVVKVVSMYLVVLCIYSASDSCAQRVHLCLPLNSFYIRCYSYVYTLKVVYIHSKWCIYTFLFFFYSLWTPLLPPLYNITHGFPDFSQTRNNNNNNNNNVNLSKERKSAVAAGHNIIFPIHCTGRGPTFPFLCVLQHEESSVV